jgi:hypothetical protein
LAAVLALRLSARRRASQARTAITSMLASATGPNLGSWKRRSR